MDKIRAILASPTVWGAIVLFLVNGIPAIRDLVPLGALPYLDAVLAILVSYLHVGSVDRAYDASATKSVLSNRRY